MPCCFHVVHMPSFGSPRRVATFSFNLLLYAQLKRVVRCVTTMRCGRRGTILQRKPGTRRSRDANHGCKNSPNSETGWTKMVRCTFSEFTVLLDSSFRPSLCSWPYNRAPVFLLLYLDLILDWWFGLFGLIERHVWFLPSFVLILPSLFIVTPRCMSVWIR